MRVCARATASAPTRDRPERREAAATPGPRRGPCSVHPRAPWIFVQTRDVVTAVTSLITHRTR